MSDTKPDTRHAIRELGPMALSSADLLALICGADVGSTLLSRHGSLSELAKADVMELRAAPGVGSARAAQIAAAFELGRRAAVPPHGGRWTIRAPRDVADRLMPQMSHLEREELRLLLLNTKNTVIRAVTVYQGNVSSAVVRVAELFRDAVRVHAAGIVVVHNHPSGDPEPSADDLHLTAEAVAAGRLLDIAVLDHVILAGDSYVSLRDRGVAFDRR